MDNVGRDRLSDGQGEVRGARCEGKGTDHQGPRTQAPKSGHLLSSYWWVEMDDWRW